MKDEECVGSSTTKAEYVARRRELKGPCRGTILFLRPEVDSSSIVF